MTEAHLSFDELRAAAHDLALRRREARADYEARALEEAEAERRFRKKLAIAFTKLRAEEKGVGESEILANGEAADERFARDLAHSQARAALLKVEETEREQATLRQLGEFSKELETIG